MKAIYAGKQEDRSAVDISCDSIDRAIGIIRELRKELQAENPQSYDPMKREDIVRSVSDVHKL